MVAPSLPLLVAVAATAGAAPTGAEFLVPQAREIAGEGQVGEILRGMVEHYAGLRHIRTAVRIERVADIPGGAPERAVVGPYEIAASRPNRFRVIPPPYGAFPMVFCDGKRVRSYAWEFDKLNYRRHPLKATAPATLAEAHADPRRHALLSEGPADFIDTLDLFALLSHCLLHDESQARLIGEVEIRGRRCWHVEAPSIFVERVELFIRADWEPWLERMVLHHTPGLQTASTPVLREVIDYLAWSTAAPPGGTYDPKLPHEDKMGPDFAASLAMPMPEPEPDPRVGQPLAPVILDLHRGGRVQVPPTAGVTVLGAWSEWSIGSLTAVLSVRQSLEQNGLGTAQFVALNVGDAVETVAERAKAWNLKGVPLGLDPDGIFAARARIDAVPTFLVVDSAGVVRAAVVGAGVDVHERVREAVRDAMKNPGPLAD